MKLSDVWSWEGVIERVPTVLGLSVSQPKYNLDRLISSEWFEKQWTLFDVDTLRFYLWQTPVEQTQETCYLTLLAVSLPFLWAGVVLTLRFVPFFKTSSFALFVLPSQDTIYRSSRSGSPRTTGQTGRHFPARPSVARSWACLSAWFLGCWPFSWEPPCQRLWLDTFCRPALRNGFSFSVDS